MGRDSAGTGRVTARLLGLAVLLGLGGCVASLPRLPEGRPGHLSGEPAAPSASAAAPAAEPLSRPEPLPAEATGPRYTVVVHELPAREVLFALARDAGLDLDLDARIEGRVTLNAIERTLPELLERIARQVALRWERRDGSLVVEPDLPYVRRYAIDYPNMARDAVKTVSVATQISSTGGDALGGAAGGAAAGGNNSTTDIESVSSQRFWQSLLAGVAALVGESGPGEGGVSADGAVIAHPESGVLVVRASQRGHREVEAFLAQVRESAHREVLVEATIVEVELTDRHRAGVDWSQLARSAGFSLQQSLLGGELGQAPFFLLNYADRDTREGSVELTVRALAEFGEVRVLSSPRLMVLNNQTALLKVVDNQVYFTIDVETTSTQGVVDRVFETTVHTVPVGFVMSVTPGIHADGSVILNVRPTLSRIASFVEDPNPALAEASVVNRIPVIQTRELESLLKLQDGQTAVLGGLMQDSGSRDTRGVPLLQDIPWLGELFKVRDDAQRKTELLVFLRPVIVHAPGLGAGLAAHGGRPESRP